MPCEALRQIRVNERERVSYHRPERFPPPSPLGEPHIISREDNPENRPSGSVTKALSRNELEEREQAGANTMHRRNDNMRRQRRLGYAWPRRQIRLSTVLFHDRQRPGLLFRTPTYLAFRLAGGPFTSLASRVSEGKFRLSGFVTHCVKDWASTTLANEFPLDTDSTPTHSLTARQSGFRHNHTRLTHRGSSSVETLLNYPTTTARKYPHEALCAQDARD